MFNILNFVTFELIIFTIYLDCITLLRIISLNVIVYITSPVHPPASPYTFLYAITINIVFRNFLNFFCLLLLPSVKDEKIALEATNNVIIKELLRNAAVAANFARADADAAAVAATELQRLTAAAVEERRLHDIAAAKVFFPVY